VLSDGDGNIVLSTNYARSVALYGALPVTGTGITFPATQSASSDANTLDDYEEGTFTPSVSAASGSYTTTTSSGKYVKVGRLVTIRMRVDITTNGTAANAMILGNIPFPTTDNNDFAGGTREDVSTGYTYTCSGQGTTSIRIQRYDATYGLGNSQGLTFCISYVAA
jgi:predicted RecA/RadA family phage recombinase